MEQFKQFNNDKQKAIDTLGKLKEILIELEMVGMDVSDGMNKISDALYAIESDILRIALLGAFSDGKTSVIAGWLGRVLDDMDIDADESSDSLAIYKPEGIASKCEIVDTPGLFGDKEKSVDEGKVKYADITKQYISEAHLIFYIVDAKNPLHESHNDIARWVLRDLNKLSSTIFIINKMDKVTDLTEQSMFDEAVAIKQSALKGKLQRAANLNEAELDQLNIVCMASNPNGRGLDFWFGKPEIYESRSRINILKTMTTTVLRSYGSDALIAKTGLDVVRDVIMKKANQAGDELGKLEVGLKDIQKNNERQSQDITKGRREVKKLAGELFNELQDMEKHLLARLRPLTLEDIREYLDDEIGYNDKDVGYKLRLKIKTAIDHYFEQTSAISNRILVDFEIQLNDSESFLESMSGMAMNSASGLAKNISSVPIEAIKGTIFAARDVLGNVGLVIKFKPWEVTKMAGAISKWAGPVGLIISLTSDAVSAYKAHEREQTLQKTKTDISGMIKESFKDIYDILGDDEKIVEFFAPGLKHIEKAVTEMNTAVHSLEENKKKISQIQDKLSAFYAEGDVLYIS